MKSKTVSQQVLKNSHEGETVIVELDSGDEIQVRQNACSAHIGKAFMLEDSHTREHFPEKRKQEPGFYRFAPRQNLPADVEKWTPNLAAKWHGFHSDFCRDFEQESLELIDFFQARVDFVLDHPECWQDSEDAYIDRINVESASLAAHHRKHSVYVPVWKRQDGKTRKNIMQFGKPDIVLWTKEFYRSFRQHRDIYRATFRERLYFISNGHLAIDTIHPDRPFLQ